jgi:pimeloyl-ACP methyl ester carboxylesterase
VSLVGTYYQARTAERVGVMVFCHEYLSDRWSFAPYCDSLRDQGFDVFTFDFRNHGGSGVAPEYKPLQWVTEYELRDLQAALAYLRSRSDRDPAGACLFGISRGGSAALCVAAKEPDVWGVITDGAFPTRGTMWAYMHRWADIYVGTHLIFQILPAWLFDVVLHMMGWSSRIRSEWRLKCRFPDVETAVARLSPRPCFMIHGEDDAYISAAIAQRFFGKARDPKHLWMVPGAKHNRCREVDPEAYRAQVADFLQRYAPRRPLPARKADGDESSSSEERSADFAVARANGVREPATAVAGGRRARITR